MIHVDGNVVSPIKVDLETALKAYLWRRKNTRSLVSICNFEKSSYYYFENYLKELATCSHCNTKGKVGSTTYISMYIVYFFLDTSIR